MKSRIFVILAAVTTVVCLSGSAFAGSAQATSGSSITVGREQLRQCGTDSYCGSMQMPLDWEQKSGPTIKVCFEWYPATDTSSPAQGTVVPVEGGPGYPSIGSVAPDGYMKMYGPLLEHWNMLAIDLRGTGCSTPLNCPAMQNYKGSSATSGFDEVVGKCAEELNHRWKAPGGGYVHASDLFTSAPAAEDMAAVVHALDLQKIDLYGDSYGSWFATIFASRYPSLIRSLTLDSTYAVVNLFPWYRSTIDEMPNDFDLACSRSISCAQAQDGVPAWTTISNLATYLRSHPISGTVPNDAGKMAHVRMGVEGLVNLVSDAAEDPLMYRTIVGAARSLLYDDSPGPLLRLYAQRLAIDEAYFGVPVKEYSVELYMAVSCLDYPQLYDMSSTPAERRVELAQSIKSLRSSTFAPFTTQEWLDMDQNTENLTACLDWPSPTIAQPPVTRGAPLLPKSMNVIVLSGEFDTWTPALNLPAVVDELGASTTRVIHFANSTHVEAEGDPYDCASVIVQEFVEDPSDASGINATCASQIPSIRAIGMFPDSLKQVQPMTVKSGPSCTSPTCKKDLELAEAAVLTAGDAFDRRVATEEKQDTGLYGGTVISSDAVLTLRDDQLVPGVKVSGTVEFPGSSKEITANVSASTGPGVTVSISAWWPEYGGQAVAYAILKLDGSTVVASSPGP